MAVKGGIVVLNRMISVVEEVGSDVWLGALMWVS